MRGCYDYFVLCFVCVRCYVGPDEDGLPQVMLRGVDQDGLEVSSDQVYKFPPHPTSWSLNHTSNHPVLFLYIFLFPTPCFLSFNVWVCMCVYIDCESRVGREAGVLQWGHVPTGRVLSLHHATVLVRGHLSGLSRGLSERLDLHAHQ